MIDEKGPLVQMRNRLVEDLTAEEKQMGKGKRLRKRRPFLEDDGMEQSEVV